MGVEELVRVGALVFAYGALYPSPPWEPKEKLVEMLQMKLEAVVTQGLDAWTHLEIGLLMWLSMMGCMMAVGPDIQDDAHKLHEFEAGCVPQDVFFKLLVWCQLRLGYVEFGEMK